MSICHSCKLKVIVDKENDLYICEVCHKKRYLTGPGSQMYRDGRLPIPTDPKVSICKIRDDTPLDNTALQNLNKLIDEKDKKLDKMNEELKRMNEEIIQLKEMINNLKIRNENNSNIMGKELDDLKEKSDEFNDYLKSKKSKKGKRI